MASQETKETDVSTDDRYSMRFVISTLKRKWPQVPSVSTEILHKWMKCAQSTQGKEADCENRALTVIDARPDFEYVVGHIDCARRVDYDSKDVQTLVNELEQQKLAGQIPTVVCYCSLGYRSCMYADTMINAIKSSPILGSDTSPKTEVYNLEGSLFKWANENRGHMVDGKNRPTKCTHPFSPIWGKLLYHPLRKSEMDD